MAFDYKKEYKEFYLPGKTPQLVEIPKMNYIAVRGKEIPIKKAGPIRNRLGFCMELRLPLR